MPIGTRRVSPFRACRTLRSAKRCGGHAAARERERMKYMMRIHFRSAIFATLAAFPWCQPAFAQNAPKLDTGNTAWMLTATALVLMMTIPGLALFYGGMVRKKNVLATVMQ